MTTNGPIASATAPAIGESMSKSERAYRHIREQIGSGAFTPGYRLVLDQIAKQLDISPVPVREAVRRLEAEGVVEFQRNVGAQVAMVDEGEYINTMQTLAIVEGAATSLTAPLIGADELRRAAAINLQMEDCLTDFVPQRFTALNLEFHAVLFEQCPNPQILDVVHRCWDRLHVLRESTFSFVPGRARSSVNEHTELLQLIEQKADALTIELAARAHRTSTLDAMIDHQAHSHHE